MNEVEPDRPLPRRRAFDVLRRYGLEALLLVGVVLGLHAWQTRNLASGEAPGFSVQALDGQTVGLEDFRGQTVLLHFWATWCPVCRLESDSIDALAQDYPVLTVALDDMADADLRQWMTARGLQFPVVRDADGSLAGLYGVGGVPTSIVIDGKGRIRFTEVGYTTGLGLRLRMWWAAK